MSSHDGKDTKRTTKAYRIYPLYFNLFNSCLTIINRDNLSDYLIRKYYQFRDIPKFNSEVKSNLLSKIIEDVKEETNNIHDIKDSLYSTRMVHLTEYYRYKRIDINKPRTPLVIRVSDELHQSIKELAEHTDTIGEVIEIAIAHHITNAPTAYYDLITFTIQNQSMTDGE